MDDSQISFYRILFHRRTMIANFLPHRIRPGEETSSTFILSLRYTKTGKSLNSVNKTYYVTCLLKSFGTQSKPVYCIGNLALSQNGVCYMNICPKVLIIIPSFLA